MNRINYQFLLLALFSIGLISCGDEKKEVEFREVEEDQNELKIEQIDLPESEVVFSDVDLEIVFDGYTDLKNALVRTNAEEAKEAASQLNTALEIIEANEALVMATAKISSTNDINVQRDEFQIVSAEMEALVKENVTSGIVYQQYCPMAFEGKGGIWLSTSQEIRNPYFGDKMLKCGSVENTYK